MNFNFFFKRPVFANVINIIILIIGLISLNKLKIREYPKIIYNTIEIKTQYQGASAENVQNQITSVIQEGISGINNIDYVKATNVNGESTIVLYLKLNANINEIFIEVMEKINKVQQKLPKTVRSPVISKSSSENVLMYILASSDVVSTTEIDQICSSLFKNKIESINGVAKVFSSTKVTDGGPYSIKGVVDPLKLQEYNITIKELKHLIQNVSLNNPLGKIIINEISFNCSFEDKFTCIDDYKNLIIKKTPNGTLYLGDFIKFEKYLSEDISTTRYNNKTLVSLSVILQSGANPIEVSKEIRKILDNIKQIVPKEVKIDLFLDSSISIKKNINSVYSTIIEAIIFVLLIILLFLGSIRLSLIPLISIPVSLAGGLFFLFLYGGSINILTLLAMVLGIGLVVDDTIVLIENIHKHVEMGKDIKTACLDGLEEIQFAVISMTFTLLAVYLPILFLEGMVGKLFLEFALVLSSTVLFSGIFALISTPYFYYLFYKKENYEWYNKFINLLNYIENLYSKFLKIIFNYIKQVLLIISLLLIYISLLYYQMPNNLFPSIDQKILIIDLMGPNGMQIDYLNKYVQIIESELLKKQYTENVYTNLSINNKNFIIITLNPKFNSNIIKKEIEILCSSVQKGLYSNVRLYSNNIFNNQDNNQLVLNILSTNNYDQMNDVCNLVRKQIINLKECNHNKVLTSKVNKEKSYKIIINEEKAKELNVDIADIIDTLSTISTGQPPVNTFINSNQQCYFKLMVNNQEMNSEDYFANFFVRQSNVQEPKLISLHNLITIKEITERNTIINEDGLTSFTYYVEIMNNNSSIDVYNKIIKKLKSIMPQGYKITPGDNLRKQIEETNSIIFLLFLALLFIYLILSAQFESFIDPFIIITTIPLSFIGSILLYSFKKQAEINIFVYIGLITLMGLITKHGILIVEFTNELLAKEEKITKTIFQNIIIKACLLRIRPILITTLAMFLGALPLIFSSGIGYEIRNSLGWIISGGILIGTFLTLLILPIVYYLIKFYKINNFNENNIN